MTPLIKKFVSVSRLSGLSRLLDGSKNDLRESAEIGVQ